MKISLAWKFWERFFVRKFENLLEKTFEKRIKPEKRVKIVDTEKGRIVRVHEASKNSTYHLALDSDKKLSDIQRKERRTPVMNGSTSLHVMRKWIASRGTKPPTRYGMKRLKEMEVVNALLVSPYSFAISTYLTRPLTTVWLPVVRVVQLRSRHSSRYHPHLRSSHSSVSKSIFQLRVKL